MSLARLALHSTSAVRADMEKSIYAMMFLTGLGGGFGHCIGMCGPLVATYSMKMKRQALLSHLIYNTGRVFTYTFLGALAGFSGSFLKVASGLEPLQKAVMVAAGIMIILMGLSMAGVFRGVINRIENNALTGVVTRISGLLNSSITEGALFPLGIVMGFIPCGLVYTSLMVVLRASMDAGSPTEAMLEGAVLMGLFGMGTMPSLMLFGRAVGFLRQRFRESLYRISSFIIIALGVYFLLKALVYTS